MFKISILGCGWLGNKMAYFLNQPLYTIKGSNKSITNTQNVNPRNFTQYKVVINSSIAESNYNASFFDCDTLIISLKPNRQQNDNGFFEQQIKTCAALANKYGITQVIFWSSTSVYGDFNQISNEQSATIPTRPSGNSLIKAEAHLLNNNKFSATILRLGGIIGYDRNPIQVIKKNRKTGNLFAPVNLVHADDILQITKAVLGKQLNNIYNIVCDAHPLRIDYYHKAYTILNKEAPQFNNSENLNFKIIDNSKVKNDLNYRFLLNDPRNIYNYQALLNL